MDFGNGKFQNLQKHKVDFGNGKPKWILAGNKGSFFLTEMSGVP